MWSSLANSTSPTSTPSFITAARASVHSCSSHRAGSFQITKHFVKAFMTFFPSAIDQSPSRTSFGCPFTTLRRGLRVIVFRYCPPRKSCKSSSTSFSRHSRCPLSSAVLISSNLAWVQGAGGNDSTRKGPARVPLSGVHAAARASLAIDKVATRASRIRSGCESNSTRNGAARVLREHAKLQEPRKIQENRC